MNHPSEKILEVLRSCGPSKVVTLCRKTGLGETTIRKHLKDLVTLGLVVRSESGQFELAPETIETGSGRKVRESGQVVQDRDDQVLGLLRSSGQLSREELAEKLGISSSLIYLSLYRLRRDGHVQQVHIGTRTPDWSIT